MPKKKSKKPQPPPLPRRVREGLYKADQLLDEAQPEEALQILEELDHRHPGLAPVLELLVTAYSDIKNMQGYEWALYRLLKIEQNIPEAVLGMAGAYMANYRPALAVQQFQLFLRRWPDHEQAIETRRSLEKLQSAFQKEMEALNLPEEETLEVARQNEEVRFFMDHHQYHQGRRVAEKLLKKHPDYVPVINNLSLINALEGKREQAIRLAYEVLEMEPENVHALSNLTCWLFLTGNQQEAEEIAQHLKASRAPAADVWTKKAEALAYLANYEGILELYQQAKKEDKFEHESPLFLHLVAVAKYNQGQERDARHLWQQALMLNPGFALARQNLEDLERPIGGRNAPWAFSIFSWINEKTIGDLYRVTESASRRKREHAVREVTMKFLEQHPEIVPLAPHLLQHGDATAREFVLNLTKITHDPALMEAIKEFSMGQRGSDDLRLQAAQLLSKEGLLPAGSIRMWSKGQWRDLMLLDFEVTSEVEREHRNPEVQSLAEEAYYALQDRDGRTAQELLEEAIVLDPDSASLYNNLAIAYEFQKKPEKAQALIREIHERFPDYFFGIVGVARLAIRDGELDSAHELLDNLMQRKRLHVTEFDTLCAAQIELSLAEKNREAARSWFEMWERPDPENPQLNLYRQRVGKA
jgi:tetratricopeptide (TPR) repeat protein